MDGTRVFGWVAGAFSVTHNVPQMWLVCRRRSAADLSGWGLAARAISLALYVVHVVRIGDPPTTVVSGVLLAQCLVLCAQKAWFGRTPAAV